jgi:hypothetical protein
MAPQSAPVAPRAHVIPVVPNAREDVPAGTGVSDRALMRESRAASPAPAALNEQEPSTAQKSVDATVRALKSRGASRLESTTGGAAQGFAAAPAPAAATAKAVTQPHIVTRPSSAVAWPEDLLPTVRTSDSLTAVAARLDTPYSHAAAWQSWRSVRELTDPGSDADRYSAGKIAEERFALWRLRRLPAGLTAAREAIGEVIRLTPAGPERTRWQRLLDDLK